VGVYGQFADVIPQSIDGEHFSVYIVKGVEEGCGQDRCCKLRRFASRCYGHCESPCQFHEVVELLVVLQGDRNLNSPYSQESMVFSILEFIVGVISLITVEGDCWVISPLTFSIRSRALSI
jgi:hypothetical protein